VYELTYRENFQYMAANQLAVCFYGHTHVPFLYRRCAEELFDKAVPSATKLFVAGELLLVNPGSVGQPRDGDERASFAIWDRRRNVITFHRVEYPLQETVSAIRRAGLPDDVARRLEIGR